MKQCCDKQRCDRGCVKNPQIAHYKITDGNSEQPGRDMFFIQSAHEAGSFASMESVNSLAKLPDSIMDEL